MTAPPSETARFRHSPALDGLRGLAVAAVVVYHLRPGALPGGFVGVDVFFVLSGFLLSALLVREAETTGRVSLGRFVIRRVRRLLPATLLVLVAIAAYAAVWAPDAELDRLRRHMTGALTYSVNWLFIADGTTYTDVVVGASPLRHMWSLAIEEQFYVVLALAVAAIAATGTGRPEALRRRLGLGAVVLAVAGTGWAWWLEADGADTARLYFGTDTRVAAMFVGVALGALAGERLLGARRGDRAEVAPSAGRRAVPIGLAGTAGLVAMMLVASEDDRWLFRGGLTLVAVATAAVLVGALGSPLLARPLCARPLVALGTISYGVYLWHWPVLVVLDEERLGLEGWALHATQVAITLGVSALSYLAVERPIRHGALGLRYGRRSLAFAPVAALAVAGLVVVTTTGDGTPDLADVVGQTPDDPALADPSLLQVTVVGDSVMHTLIGGRLGDGLTSVPWNQSQSSFDTDRVAVTTIARPACSFLPGLVAFEEPGGYETADLSAPCGDWRGDLDRSVRREVPADVTVVMPSNDLEDREVDGRIVAFATTEWEDLFFDWTAEVIGIAQAGGGEVVLLAPAPRIDPNWSSPQGERERRVAEIFDVVAQANPGVSFIDLGEFVGDDRAVRDDGLHYTDDGARRVAEWLTPQLETIAG